MAHVASLSVEITADPSGLQTGLRQADQGVNQFGQSMNGLRASLNSIASSAAGLGIALSASVTAPIVGVAALGLSFNAMRERAMIAFTQLLGSAEKADSFLRELARFAAATPFEFPELVGAAQKFTAVGIQAKGVIPIMTALGDAVAAFGGTSETINRVTEQIVQMIGKGKVSMEEMRLIGQAIPGSLKAMADEMGISVAELFKKMEKGTVSAAEGLEAMLVGLTKKFNGQMENQSKGFTGMMSTLKDTVRFAAGDITENLFGIIKGGLAQLVEILPKVTAGFMALPDPIKMAGLAIAGVAAAIGPVLLGVAGLIAVLGGPLTLAVVGITVTFMALAAAVALNFSRILEVVTSTTGGIRINFVAVAGYLGGVADAFQVLARVAVAAFDVIVTGVILMAQGVKLAFNTIKDAGTAALALASNDMPGFAMAMASMATTTVDSAKSISASLRGLAQRGIADVKDISSHLSGQFVKSFEAAAKGASTAVSTIKRSMAETIQDIRDAMNDISGTGGGAGAGAGKKLKDQTEKLLREQLSLVNDWLKAIDSTVQISEKVWEKLLVPETKVTLVKAAAAFHAVQRVIEQGQADLLAKQISGFAGQKQAIEVSISDWQRWGTKIQAVATQFGATIKVVFPSTTKAFLDWAESMTFAFTKVTDVMAANVFDTDRWADGLVKAFEKTSDAAPHWAGAIVDAAAAVKTAMEDSALLIRTKAEIEIHRSFESIVQDFITLGEQAKLTGTALLDFVENKVSKLGPLLREGAQKAVQEFKNEMFKLPGALDEVFNKMASGAKKQVSGLFQIIDNIPGKFGDALRKSTNEVTRWIDQIDGILKGLHKIFNSIPDGLADMFSKVSGIFKKSTTEAKSASQDWSGSLEKISKGSTATQEKVTSAFSLMGTAISAFATGTAIAAATANKAISAIGGAAMGAYQGFLAGGPLGAVIGGIAGLFGGLFGGGKKAQEAAVIQKAQDDAKILQQTVLQSIEQTKQSWIETLDKGRLLLESIAFYSKVPKLAFNQFFQDMNKLFKNMVELAKKWKLDATADIKAAAENLSAGVALISQLPAALEGISRYLGTSDASFNTFFAAAAKYFDKLEEFLDTIPKSVAKSIGKFSKWLSSGVSLLAPLTDGLRGLLDLKDIPTDAQFGLVNLAIDKIITNIGLLGQKFEKGMLKQMAFFSEKAGAALSLWKDTIDAIKATVGIQPLSETDAENLVSGLTMFMDKLTLGLGKLNTEDLTRVSAMAQTILPIAGAIKAWAETSTAVRGYTVIAAEAWDAIVTDFNKGIQLMAILIGQAIQFEQMAITLETHLKSGAQHLTDGINAMAGAVLATASALQSAYGHLGGGVQIGGPGALSVGGYSAMSLAPAAAGHSVNVGSIIINGTNLSRTELQDAVVEALVKAEKRGRRF